MKRIVPTALILLAACSSGERRPAVPRPYAYHRPLPADTIMQRWENGAETWTFSSEALATSPRPDWLTVNYPQRGLTLYITYTRARGEELEAARINRMERLLLNAGSGSATEQEYVNRKGWHIYMLKSQNPTAPLQFLATDGDSMLVSGTLQCTVGHDDYEAIRPDVEIVARDIYTSLSNIGLNEAH